MLSNDILHYNMSTIQDTHLISRMIIIEIKAFESETTGFAYCKSICDGVVAMFTNHRINFHRPRLPMKIFNLENFLIYGYVLKVIAT